MSLLNYSYTMDNDDYDDDQDDDGDDDDDDDDLCHKEWSVLQRGASQALLPVDKIGIHQDYRHLLHDHHQDYRHLISSNKTSIYIIFTPLDSRTWHFRNNLWKAGQSSEV